MTNIRRARVHKDIFLEIPAKEQIKFDYPLVEASLYQDAGREILKRGLKIPTGEEIAFLLNEVYFSRNREFIESEEVENIRKSIKKEGLWVFNRMLWTPTDDEKAGLYVSHDEKVLGMHTLKVEELEESLSKGFKQRGVRFSSNGKTAFAPYKTFDRCDLHRNGFIVANFGIEGAEKIERVAQNGYATSCLDLVESKDAEYTQTVLAVLYNNQVHKRREILFQAKTNGLDGNCFALGIRR